MILCPHRLPGEAEAHLAYDIPALYAQKRAAVVRLTLPQINEVTSSAQVIFV